LVATDGFAPPDLADPVVPPDLDWLAGPPPAPAEFVQRMVPSDARYRDDRGAVAVWVC
jgi:hypothetical protein